MKRPFALKTSSIKNIYVKPLLKDIKTLETTINEYAKTAREMKQYVKEAYEEKVACITKSSKTAAMEGANNVTNQSAKLKTLTTKIENAKDTLVKIKDNLSKASDDVTDSGDDKSYSTALNWITSTNNLI